MLESNTPLPAVIAGPLLRRLESTRLLFWLVTSKPLSLELRLYPQEQKPRRIGLEPFCQALPIGAHAFVYLIDVPLDEPLPVDQVIGYDLLVGAAEAQQPMATWAPHLLHEGKSHAEFVLRAKLDQLLHGSCRKPHHPSDDGLLCADRLIAQNLPAVERPALLLLNGDQVYLDDVAGPMLQAIHQVIRRLGMFDEYLEGAEIPDSLSLHQSPASYYQRPQLLPNSQRNQTLQQRFFGGVKKPIFTSASADNHLVSLSEMLAMYLLVWSPTPWLLVDDQLPELEPEYQERYLKQLEHIQRFRLSLPKAARALAHLSTLMIFDDHDITDDWNLSARWEQTAYGHPFSKRIIGNALIAYLLCQGWGNNPDALNTPIQACLNWLVQTKESFLEKPQQDVFIDQLLAFKHWHYVLPTEPALVVLDTRTRRWRSEGRLSKPSGLMDWEALCEFQQELLDHPCCIIVSPAPMFGVKLIENIQKIFTLLGKPLMIDAENWMAHRDAASVMLNIFRHSRTPGDFVVLSGDVHYSFVYRISIRGRRARPNIWQITSSGVKNEFPKGLLNWLDRLNRWLYAPWSPLNLLTQRRHMRVSPLIPNLSEAGERLWNRSGLGQVFFDAMGRPEHIIHLNADNSPPAVFISSREISPIQNISETEG